MASHNYQQFQYGLEKYPVTLYANIPIGATGAVGTLDPKKNQGIYSVVRTGAGLYTINFGVLPQLQIDKYVRLLMLDAVILNATVADANVEVVADNAASGNVQIRFTSPTSAGVTTAIATDPPNGAVILLSIVLKNSSV